MHAPPLLAAVIAAVLGADARAASLDEAWAAAEQHNVELRLAREQVAQAVAVRGEALTALMPRLTAGASYTINQNEYAFDPTAGLPPELVAAFGDDLQPVVIQPKSSWTANVHLQQPLFSGLAVPAWQAARDLAQAADQDYRRARDQLRGSVARAYYALAVARDGVPLTEQAADTARHVLDVAHQQVEVGVADRRVVLQAELSVARADRDLDAAHERVAQAEESFTRVTGLPRSTPVVIPDPPGVPADVETAVQLAMSSRPDIAGAAERVEAARKERTGRDLEWLPTASLGFTELYQQVPGFVASNWQWRVSVDFDWTLWDGGLRLFRSRELASRTRTASLVVEQRALDAEREVRTTWERLDRARTAYEAVESEVALAEESLRLTQAAFEVGQATWLDVEQARLSLTSAQTGRLTERMDRDLAAIDLLVAIGAL